MMTQGLHQNQALDLHGDQDSEKVGFLIDVKVKKTNIFITLNGGMLSNVWKKHLRKKRNVTNV